MFKFLFTLFSIFLVAKDCNQNKLSNQDSKDLKLTYHAISRGFFKTIGFEDSKLIYSEDPNLKSIDTFDISKKEWLEITETLNKINLNVLETLKSPTEKRLYDGAAHTTITVVSTRKTYTSSSFDEGHPPAEIEELINKMLTISEKYLQQ